MSSEIQKPRMTPKVLTIRLLEEEKEAIRKAAKISDMSMNTYCTITLFLASKAVIENEKYKQDLSSTGGDPT